MRILVVEPDWWVAALLADGLTASGHEVAGLARDAVTALALAEAVKPEVAIVYRDLGQDGDGVAVARLLREHVGRPAVFTVDRLDDDAAHPTNVMPGVGLHSLLRAVEAARARG